MDDLIPLEQIYENLCSRDPRNPIYADLYKPEDWCPPPREDCWCDNCCYGKDPLALEIIKLHNLLNQKENE